LSSLGRTVRGSRAPSASSSDRLRWLDARPAGPGAPVWPIGGSTLLQPFWLAATSMRRPECPIDPRSDEFLKCLGWDKRSAMAAEIHHRQTTLLSPPICGPLADAQSLGRI
jgi:hypothetical protein